MVESELNQTRSELNDLSVSLDTLIVRVNTQGFQISDNVTDISNLQLQVGTLTTTVNNAAAAAAGAQTTANTALANASAAQTTAGNAQSSATQAQATADNAVTLANTASTNASNAINTANAAQTAASQALDQALRSVVYLNQWPTIASRQGTVFAYAQNQNWYTVVITTSGLGDPIMTETNYQGNINIRSPTGSESTAGWNFVAFRAPGNFNSTVPIRLRAGSWRLVYGNSATGGTSVTVLVQDFTQTQI